MIKRIRWKTEEDQLLIEKYFKSNIEDLRSLLQNRSWNSIVLRAKMLGIRRDNINRNGDLNILLEDTPESFYWMGFIAADGYLNQIDQRLVVGLGIKDIEHLKKLGKYLKTNTLSYKTNCRISVKQVGILEKISKKFQLSHNKTYEPPNLAWITNNDLLLSFLIGFIDGDGCITNQYGRKDYKLTIKIHSNWLNILKFFEEKMYELSKIDQYKQRERARINKEGYATLTISDCLVLNFLKEKTVELKLPILERKWNVITGRISRYTNAKHNRAAVAKLILLEKSGNEIAKELGISISYVSQLRKKMAKTTD